MALNQNVKVPFPEHGCVKRKMGDKVYMYKSGWNISTGQLVHGTILAICLIFVGALLYKEKITPTKLAGIAICSIGLFLINK